MAAILILGVGFDGRLVVGHLVFADLRCYGSS